VAAVGLTAEQATAAGLRIRVVGTRSATWPGQAVADDYGAAPMMVVDEDRKVIVGLTLAGPGTAR